MKINYQTELDKIIEGFVNESKTPSLLLHSCCAPCSSYVLEYLTKYFNITVFYYNPNIYPQTEFEKRLKEQERLINTAVYPNPVGLIVPKYDPQEFYVAAQGFENEREGGLRCSKCFSLRLEKTAAEAKRLSFDMFCTTLTVSPHKNAQVINALGINIGEKFGIPFLVSDFKKREGYKRSIELSAKYSLYRQNWCGCEFAMQKGSNLGNE